MVKLIGFTAAVLTTVSFLPQAVKVIRTRNTAGISLTMYVVFATGVFLWLVYGLFMHDTPIIFANFITLILSVIILIMKLRYK